MTNIYLYVLLGIISSWLVFNCFLCYYIIFYDKSFDFVIRSTSKLIKFWAIIIIFGIISFYIFFLRFRRIGLVLDSYAMGQNLWSFINQLSWFNLLMVVLFSLLVIIFWFLFLKCILQYLRKSILALYLYYFQYDFFRTYVCYALVHMDSNYRDYLWSRVRIFTANYSINTIALYIWPRLTDLLERNIFYFLIPYLVTFDIITQDGFISKVFIVLPWFYIYTIIRGFLILMDKFFTEENQDMSERLYGIR